MDDDRQTIIENYVSAYNNYDIVGMTKNLSEDIIFENIRNGKVDLRTEGISEFKKQAESVKQYFEKREQIIESWNFNEDRILIEIRYMAVLAKDFSEDFKKGDTIKLRGTSEFQFENKRIKKITDES